MIKADEQEAFDEIRTGMEGVVMDDDHAVDLLHTRLLEARCMCLRYAALFEGARKCDVAGQKDSALFKEMEKDYEKIVAIRNDTQLVTVDHVLKGSPFESHDVLPKLRRYDKLLLAVDEFCETGEYNELSNEWENAKIWATGSTNAVDDFTTPVEVLLLDGTTGAVEQFACLVASLFDIDDGGLPC